MNAIWGARHEANMSRYKAKVTGTPEVHHARSKLDGLLQTMVDKKDESPIKDEMHEDIDNLHSAPTTPKKGAASANRGSRKRKRGKDDFSPIEATQYHHTYVMKLFDRSVDLAQFEVETPLYPICRAWMKNQPHNKNLATRPPKPDESIPEEDELDETGEKIVYKLPEPVPIKSEEGGEIEIDLRVPMPIEQSDEPLNIHADPTTAPAPEQLLLKHMMRWKNIRQSWKDAAKVNESRYMDSLTILKEMFDRQCKDQ